MNYLNLFASIVLFILLFVKTKQKSEKILALKLFHLLLILNFIVNSFGQTLDSFITFSPTLLIELDMLFSILIIYSFSLFASQSFPVNTVLDFFFLIITVFSFFMGLSVALPHVVKSDIFKFYLYPGFHALFLVELIIYAYLIVKRMGKNDYLKITMALLIVLSLLIMVKMVFLFTGNVLNNNVMLFGGSLFVLCMKLGSSQGKVLS